MVDAYLAYKLYQKFSHPWSNVWSDERTRVCCKCGVAVAVDYCTDRLVDSPKKFYLHFSYAKSSEVYTIAETVKISEKGADVTTSGQVTIKPGECMILFVEFEERKGYYYCMSCIPEKMVESIFLDMTGKATAISKDYAINSETCFKK